MKLIIALLLFAIFTGCSTTSDEQGRPISPPQVSEGSFLDSEEVRLWATFYYLKVLEPTSRGVPLRNMDNEVIGPKLSESDWCKAAIEGTLTVNGDTYNFAGTRWPRQANCSHSPSEKVRWKKSNEKYGLGNKNNPLIPFVTIACDQGVVSGSEPFIKDGYMKFGQKVFIPEAKGVQLPNGKVHDGIFICGDVGGSITGNHIDVFLGPVSGGLREALKINPFEFIKSNSDKTFKAYLVE